MLIVLGALAGAGVLITLLARWIGKWEKRKLREKNIEFLRKNPGLVPGLLEAYEGG